jgi:hypothetical protein
MYSTYLMTLMLLPMSWLLTLMVPKRLRLFHTNNTAVVSILNNMSSKSDRIMSLLRPNVYWTLILHFQFKAKHVFSIDNCIADVISRRQVERVRRLATSADAYHCHYDKRNISVFKHFP